MAQIWTLCLSVLIGFITIFIVYFIRKTFKHFYLKGFKFNRFNAFRFATDFQDLKGAIFPKDSAHSVAFKSFYGGLVIEVIDFKFKLSNSFKLVFSIGALNIYFNSSFLIMKPTKKFSSKSTEKNSPSRFWYYLLKTCLKTFEFYCKNISIIVTFGDTCSTEAFVAEVFAFENVEICKNSSSLLAFSTAKLEQLTIENDQVESELIFETKFADLSREWSLSKFDLYLLDKVSLNINVRFLYFLSSFIKSLETDENEDIKTKEFVLPWAMFFSLRVPEIDFKLILPETDPSVKYFKWLQFKFTKIDAKAFCSTASLPCLTAWLDTFELAVRIDDEIGAKNFCPIDKLLGRGPEQVVGQTKKLITAEKVVLCNWNKNKQATSLPVSIINEWIKTLLDGTPLCSIKNDAIDLSSMEFDSSNFEPLLDRTSAVPKITFEFFKFGDIKASKSLYGFLNQFDFNVPFELPISNLIDHSVVLFKAGWRPLSSKTERGYWIGDGDKFLRTDWNINLNAKHARLRVEDDAFETKLSAISHFQRKLAESRSRLEPVLLSEIDNDGSENSNNNSNMYKLAKQLAVSTDEITASQATALIELNKTLFSEYKDLIGKSHLLTNWSLVDLAIDNLKASLSWSPEYLGSKGTLSALLNRIEDCDQIKLEDIDTLSTFLGGFLDLSGSDFEIHLRNYSRPILIAPDLRITGPVFLVEDGVKDPEVLVKFPVRVLSSGINSCFPNLPAEGTVDVLRSILPLKLYHCVQASISPKDLVQATVSPYWLGCLALLDRVIDRFVKSSTEDPSPPLPGWDKLRYNVHGCHSRLTIASPCIISRIADSDPLSCTEVLNLSFPHGVDVGIVPGGSFVLKCPEASLNVDSQFLFPVRSALESSGPLHLWDLGVADVDNSNNFSNSSLDLSQNTVIPTIKLSKTHLELKFQIKNVFNEDPCHHWTVRPISRSNAADSTDWEYHDTFKYFRSKSIAMELSGFVGGNNDEGEMSDNDIRFLYYREFERWISRFMGAHTSDIDVVKRGPLHQSAAIPEIQHRTSFSSVFNEFHLSVDFSDLFICRLLNFSSSKDSQALWSASCRSLLNMDWRRGVVDQHGREDWVYYYGELEFLNVQFSVTSNVNAVNNSTSGSSDFPVKIPGIQFNNLLRAPRLFYLSLDENCFQYDPGNEEWYAFNNLTLLIVDSLQVQCQTVLKRRQALLTSLSEVTKHLSHTPKYDSERVNQFTIAIEALQKRQKYYDTFLYKAQSNALIDNISELYNSAVDLEFADTSHFEIYNAQLVWSLANRDIVFKFVDELFVLQKKKFSQNRTGLQLMRKMSQVPITSTAVDSDFLKIPADSNVHKSPILSPKETIDSFFESLLERKSFPNSPSIGDLGGGSGPFTAKSEPKGTDQGKQSSFDIRKGFDFRSPSQFRDGEFVSVPRIVDISFFNPQLCFMTPSHIPSGAILVTAHEAKVEFSPIFDRILLLQTEREFFNEDSSGTASALDAKMGTRTKISLQKASVFSGTKAAYKVWPEPFLQQCYAQDLATLQKLTENTEITMVYDVSNVAYSWTPTSPRIKIFGHGDTIKFSSNGLALTTTSENFRSLLDVIVNLLVYRDSNQEIRAEKLETLLIAANLSDRRMFAAKMDEFRSRLDALRCQLTGRREFELKTGEIEALLKSFDSTERELALIGEVMRMIQASREELNQKRSRLTLNVLIERLQWNLLVSKLNEPSFDLQPACKISLQDISNRWISKEDGSMENTFEIGTAHFINQLPVPFYRNVLRPFDVHHGQDGVQLKATVDYGCLLRFFAKSQLPVNGIQVLDHVEVDLSPLQLQLTLDIATQIYKFFLPENLKKRKSNVDLDSPLTRTTSMRPRTRTEISDLILTGESTDVLFDEAIEMKQRTEQNVFFVYVKVPPSQHLVSYKGTGKSSLLDIDRFILSLPEMEYNNKLWSWPEFFNQLRKDTIVVLLKNAGSLFKDKIKKLGKKNLPELPENVTANDDEIYLKKLAKKEKIDVLDEDFEAADEEDQSQRDKKNFLVFGKSIFKLMKK